MPVAKPMTLDEFIEDTEKRANFNRLEFEEKAKSIRAGKKNSQMMPFDLTKEEGYLDRVKFYKNIATHCEAYRQSKNAAGLEKLNESLFNAIKGDVGFRPRNLRKDDAVDLTQRFDGKNNTVLLGGRLEKLQALIGKALKAKGALQDDKQETARSASAPPGRNLKIEVNPGKNLVAGEPEKKEETKKDNQVGPSIPRRSF